MTPNQNNRNPFYNSLKNSNHDIGLIAEYKRKSPSQGHLTNEDITSVVQEYEKANADAISILTNEEKFNGSKEDIIKAKKHTTLPVLRKDFITDYSQIKESKKLGADAILLIAEQFQNQNKLNDLYNYAQYQNLECLIETHTEENIQKISNRNYDIIGINNRNLNNLETNISHFENNQYLTKEHNGLLVSESGIKNNEDVQKIYNHGADAILAGTTLLKTNNKKQKIKQLTQNLK